eukprot:NODE_205_length_1191_cov_290.029135_g201_i0.p2 GENE.NODE_205_length_1191_cov_290.029135_g201_i0~~NODE_205_length_1191_cov_290.029135_g201_i0.p2  ORF type:complete len:152 (+),score=59.59 NODE_205_length_1191_cov_290.029135_g201_i0:576-1031(+)
MVVQPAVQYEYTNATGDTTQYTMVPYTEGGPVTPVSDCPISNIAREKEMFYDGEDDAIYVSDAGMPPQQQQYYYAEPPPPPPPPAAPDHPAPPPPPIFVQYQQNQYTPPPAAAISTQTSPPRTTSPPQVRQRHGFQPRLPEGKRAIEILSV